jgi:hypothetical protein
LTGSHDQLLALNSSWHKLNCKVLKKKVHKLADPPSIHPQFNQLDYKVGNKWPRKDKGQGTSGYFSKGSSVASSLMSGHVSIGKLTVGGVCSFKNTQSS